LPYLRCPQDKSLADSKCGKEADSAYWVGYLKVDKDEAGEYNFHIAKKDGDAQLSLDGVVILDTSTSQSASLDCCNHLSPAPQSGPELNRNPKT